MSLTALRRKYSWILAMKWLRKGVEFFRNHGNNGNHYQRCHFRFSDRMSTGTTKLCNGKMNMMIGLLVSIGRGRAMMVAAKTYILSKKAGRRMGSTVSIWDEYIDTYDTNATIKALLHRFGKLWSNGYQDYAKMFGRSDYMSRCDMLHSDALELCKARGGLLWRHV